MFGNTKNGTKPETTSDEQDTTVEVKVFGPFSLDELAAKLDLPVDDLPGERDEHRTSFQLGRFDTVVGLIEAVGDNWGEISNLPGAFRERMESVLILATYIEGGISSLKEAGK